MVTILLFEVNYICNTGASPLALGKSILYILISDKRALVFAVPGQPVLQPDAVITSNSIQVTWKPPLEPNGIIKTFELCWSEARNGSNSNCLTFNSAKRSYNIVDLSK